MDKPAQPLPADIERLCEQLADLEHIFNTAPIGLALLDRDLRFVRINPQLAEIIGVPVADHIDRTLREVLPAVAPTVEPLCEQVFATGRPVIGMEVRGVTPTQPGERAWLVNYLPMYGDDGSVRALSVMMQEITDRTRADSTLQESQRRLRAFLENSAVIAWMKDEEGRHVFLSDNYQRRFESPFEEWQGKTDFDVWPREIAEAFRRNDLAVLAADCAIEVVEEATNSDGSRSWWLNHKFPFQDATGRRYVGGLGVDITDRKRAEEALRQARDELEQRVQDRTAALRESEERFRATFEQAAVGIAHVAPDGRFLRVNQKLCEIVGYGPDELLARTFQDITHPDDLDTDLQYVQQVLEGRIQTYAMEKRYYRKDKSLVWVNLTVSLVRDNGGEPKYFISVVENIDQRKNAEEQLRLKERLLRKLLDLQEQERRLVAQDIHDGFVQDVVGAHLHVQSIQSATDPNRAEATAVLVGVLLQKAIAEGRRLIRDLRPLILDESGIVESLEHLIADEQQHQELRVDFTHDVRFHRLDRELEGAIFRIVQEAISNVRRHARTNCVVIALSQHETALRIDICDRGIGFDPGKVAPDRFGLSGIRERARLFGGTSRIDSTPGMGTTIVVNFPLDNTTREITEHAPSKIP